MKEYKFKINGNEYAVTVKGISDGKATVTVNGQEYSVDCPRTESAVGTSPDTGTLIGTQPTNSPEGNNVAKVINAPLPGVILNLYVMPGQNVKRGDKIAVLEAMKMENDILAPSDGTIKEVFVQRGDSILEGAKIATIA